MVLGSTPEKPNILLPRNKTNVLGFVRHP